MKLSCKKVVNQPELLGQVHQTLEQRYKNKLMRYGSYMLWQSILETFDKADDLTVMKGLEIKFLQET